MNTCRLTIGASVGPAARVPGKVAPPAAPALGFSRGNSAAHGDVLPTMNPEIRHLIATGILRTAPLRPRSLGDLPRIRAAFALGRAES